MAAHERLSPQQFTARYKPYARAEVDWSETAYGHNDMDKQQAYKHANGAAWGHENGYTDNTKVGSGYQPPKATPADKVFRPNYGSAGRN